MKKEIVLTVLVTITSFSIVASAFGLNDPEVIAKYGVTPRIDGEFGISEWTDASTVYVEPEAILYFKQDGSNLYVGFNVSDEKSSSDDYAAFLFDVEYNKGSVLGDDDLFFWVNREGTVKEYAGIEGSSSWTETSVSGWAAAIYNASNFWQGELNISYTKIQVEAGVEKTLGIGFGTVDMPTSAFVWPPSLDMGNPSTWGNIASTGYDWIPEFPSLLILPLFMTLILLAATAYRRKHKASPVSWSS